MIWIKLEFSTSIVLAEVPEICSTEQKQPDQEIDISRAGWKTAFTTLNSSYARIRLRSFVCAIWDSLSRDVCSPRRFRRNFYTIQRCR